MISKKWSQDEKQFLKDNYHKMTAKEISTKLNKSISSVKNMVRYIKVYKKCTGVYTPFYKIYKRWASIKNRCVNEKYNQFINYGGRGISMCDEWINSPENFIEWAINNGYQEHLTIDRIDNNGNYCPENCRWVTRKFQQNNRRVNILLTAFGETKTLMQWSEDDRCKVCYNTLFWRYTSNNLTPEEMITTLPRKGRIKNAN